VFNFFLFGFASPGGFRLTLLVEAYLEMKGLQVFWEWQRNMVQVVIREIEMVEIIHVL
jgi:hypothetical protein